MSDNETDTLGGSPLISPREIWAMLVVQRYILYAVLGVSVALGGLYSFVAERVYKSTTVLQVSLQAGQEVKVDEVVDKSTFWYDSANFLNTQIDILKSRSLCSEVVRRYEALGKDDLKVAEDGASVLASKLVVSPRPNSELIDVSVLFSDPDKATILANLMAEVYRENNLAARRDSAREAREWLDQQIKEKREETVRLTGELLTYQGQTNLADAGESATQISARIASLNEAFGGANTQRVVLETRLREHERLARGGRWVELAKDLDTPLLRALVDDQADLLTEQARVESRYGGKHPETERVRNSLAALDTKMRAEVTRTLSTEETQLVAMKAREASLQKEIDAAHGGLLDRRKVLEKYERLRADLDLAKELYGKLTRRQSELDLAARTQLSNVRVVDPARSTGRPVSPNVPRTMALAVLLGLMGGAALALLREYLDDRISSPIDVQMFLRVPFLGSVPMLSRQADRRTRALFTHQEPLSAAAEAIRAVRTMLDLNPDGRAIRRLLVTSSLSSEGKTNTSVNLAVAFADLGRRVLLIDADLRRPSVHHVFGCDKEPGLSNVLRGTAPDLACIRDTEIGGLQILPAGPGDAHPNELLAGVSMSEALERFSDQYDLVLIDTPPSGMLADAAMLSQHVDGVILVVRDQTVSRAVVRDVLARLRQVGAPLLGVILNAVDFESTNSRYRYYGYRYERYYGEDRQASAAK